MSAEKIITVSNVSKKYRLGVFGANTLGDQLKSWWARIRKKPNPLGKVGQGETKRSDGKEFWALRDINFEVNRGEVVGIIGKNGAGKSTLLKILSNISAPTTGEIRMQGRIASLLEVGTGFHPELTGRENVFLNGAILGMSKAEIQKKFNEIVEFSGIEHHIDTPVKRYSSGMKVRLGFAVAAHLEPEILVIDEVLAVGDVEFQNKCIGKMQDVANAGRTVLFVSHNMSAVRNICSRAIVLTEGNKAFDGSVDDGIAFYLEQNVKSTSSTRHVDFSVDNKQNYVSYID
ncbi:MAG: ABC transporter ATP-binding protein, partial [Flavobacteriales bacterium]